MPMKVRVFDDPQAATRSAADSVAEVLMQAGVRNVMLAGGNTPLALYAELARRALPLEAITFFALDEYVGVPLEDPRTCANLIRRTVVGPWGLAPGRFCALSSVPSEAAAGIERHEHLIRESGGLDLVILGLGRNGHVGFNEPGSDRDSPGRVLDLAPPSVEANRAWFGGEHAPEQGVTTGLKTILAARRVVLLAFGAAKAEAARAMATEPPSAKCPASWLQEHADARIFLDREAAAMLPQESASSQSDAPESGGAKQP